MPNPTGTINADEDHSGKTITNVPDPSVAQDVATKAYADSVGSGGVNSFGTIAVSGQSNVVADAAPDTLTLVAGTNVTLTTNASTDTVTIAAAGGGAVSSVFTRTGAVVAATNDYTFAQIGSKPTTLAGYGITGTLTEFNTALTGADFASGGGTATGTNTGDQTIMLTGDVTGTGTGSFAATVANDAVTYAKIQNVSAASKLLGRGDSGSGDAQEITLGGNLTMTGTTLDTTAGSAGVSDAAYDSSWNGVTGTAPSKNAVYDALQTIGSSGTTVKVAGSDFTTSSTTLVDITGLTFAASATKLYEVDVLLKVQSSSSAGLKIAIQYSAAGATPAVLVWAGTGAVTAVATAHLDAFNTAPTTNYAPVAATDRAIYFKGLVTTGANAGNITIQILKTTSGTATVYIGSRMTVTALT